MSNIHDSDLRNNVKTDNKLTSAAFMRTRDETEFL